MSESHRRTLVGWGLLGALLVGVLSAVGLLRAFTRRWGGGPLAAG